MSETVGVDLGGTNLRIALFRGDDTTAVAQHKSPVGEPRDPETIVERIAATIDRLLADNDVTTARIPVGVGIAAMLRDNRGTVAHSPHLRWHDVSFGDMLRERLGDDRPVVITNDVNAITYGEWSAGAGRGVDDLLAVFVGTGIGGGLVAAGNLIEGATNCSGEIGHFTVVYDDKAASCACGRRGCVEAYVGGKYLQRRIRGELTGGARSIAVRMAGGAQNVTMSHIDAAAADGDDYSLELYTELAPMLAATLSNAVMLLNPARLVLGGGVMSRTPVFREHIIAAIQVGTIPACMDELEIVEAELGDDAGLVGSARLARARTEAPWLQGTES
jgi:glucokinase